MLGDLLLLSGNDIPFLEARVSIHQPTLKEIAYIGEDAFFIGCGFLDFSKKMLNSKDKTDLEKYDDFDILMTIMTNRDKTVRKAVDSALLVLNLIFPLYEIEVRVDRLVLKKDKNEFFITKENYPIFKNILIDIFNLHLGDKKSSEEYNPIGDLSKKIAEKFKKRHETLLSIEQQKNKNDNREIAILSRYASILAVGGQKNLNDLMQYTVYQLYNEFQRFQMKMQWDAYIQAKMAGAQDLEEIDHWMIDFLDQKKNKK